MNEELERRVRALEEAVGGTGYSYTPRFRDGRLPYQVVTTAANVTLQRSDLNIIWIIENTAAIDVTLPSVAPGDWVIVINDSGSSNDITLKDSGASTIMTLTPGDASGMVIGDTNDNPTTEP